MWWDGGTCKKARMKKTKWAEDQGRKRGGGVRGGGRLMDAAYLRPMQSRKLRLRAMRGHAWLGKGKPVLRRHLTATTHTFINQKSKLHIDTCDPHSTHTCNLSFSLSLLLNYFTASTKTTQVHSWKDYISQPDVVPISSTILNHNLIKLLIGDIDKSPQNDLKTDLNQTSWLEINIWTGNKNQKTLTRGVIVSKTSSGNLVHLNEKGLKIELKSC